LLSLGISCTNTLDEVKAMNFLKRWLMLNPKYQMKGIDNIIPDSMVNQPTYKVEEIKMVNDALIKAFDDAAKMNPNDPELLSASAILFFIKREYEVSIDLFNRALNLDPTNYLLMNKVGATLAHLGRADEAIKFYHRALDIRPNYVRVWVNIGIAHAFKGLYEEAANFYLNALSFRPDAKHIWSYLHTCFLSLRTR
jgi:peroxin-5